MIVQLDGTTFACHVPALAEVLVDAVDSGASVGFLAPLDQDDAAGWWRAWGESVAAGSTLTWVARDASGIAGTVSVVLAAKANARHRAELVKLMVLRRARGAGLARRLLATAEAAAVHKGVSLLLLDTETASAADRLYQATGWTRYGIVPDYAADPGGTLRDCSFYYKELA
jgi:GNAT superfamily N-acetyltransferase